MTGWHEVAGLSNLDFNSPNVQKTTFEMLNGRSVQRTGAAQASTLTAQMASNQSSPIFDVLLSAKNKGTTLQFRFSTAPAESLFDSNKGGANGTVAIAQSTGVCTFAGSGDGLPNFGGDDAGQFAVGHAILMDGDATVHRIAEIGVDTANSVKGTVKVVAPTGDIAAAAYNIINPQAVLTFQGSVTQVGNISAAPSSAVNTDTLEVSATNVINFGDFVFNGTGV